MFKMRFVCVKGIAVTDTFAVKDSKTVAKIEPGDALESTGCLMTDDSKGMTRLECQIVSSGKTGFVTVQGNHGTKYIEQVTPFSMFCSETDKTIAEKTKSVGKVSNLLNSKSKELAASGKEGPLADAREQLSKLRPRVSAALDAIEKLKKKVAVAKRDFKKTEEAEKNAHIEAREKKEAEALTSVASEKVSVMEAAAKSVDEAAKPLLSVADAEIPKFATPATVKDTVEKVLQDANARIKEAKQCVAEQQAALPKTQPLKGAMLEAKNKIARLSTQVESARKQCAGTMAKVRKACMKIVEAAQAEAASALRSVVQKNSSTLEKLFLEIVTPGDERISPDAFCKYLEGLDGHAFRTEHLRLLCNHLEAGGVGRRKFLTFLQQYFVVAKPIAITNEFEISKGKSLRKAETDEQLEVLEGPRTDDKLGVTRVKARSLSDGTEGWITVKGNQGTPFLKEVEKPYYACKKDLSLGKDFSSHGDEGLVRTLKSDEVLELLEGPRKESFGPGQRIRAKATSDGVTGWLTASDKRGTVFAEADGRSYTCTSSIAMTDNMDIKACKVIRKLAVDEVFIAEEGPIEEKEAGVTRVKGRAAKDDAVGWVTIKGNAGTVYAEASTKHYTVIKETPLQKKFASSSEQVRVLASGEAVEALEGPKKETFPPEVRVRCRAISDGAEGWVLLQNDTLRPWTPHYTCKKAVPLHDVLASEGASALRQVEVGERLELIEGPVEEAGELRIKAEAAKDNAVGWITVRDKEGKRFLES